MSKRKPLALFLSGLLAWAAAVFSVGGCASTGPVTQTLGWTGREVLERPENRDFQARYDTVAVDSSLLPLINQASRGVEVIVFMGTWCSDSKREVPHFLKVADRCAWPPDRIRLYCLDRSKKSDDGMTERYAIERIPTFIFLKAGREIGRITEYPRTSLEGDILEILAAHAQEGR